MRYVVELRDGSNKSHGSACLHLRALRKIKEANLVAFTAESKSWWLGCRCQIGARSRFRIHVLVRLRLQKLNAMTESACGGPLTHLMNVD